MDGPAKHRRDHLCGMPASRLGPLGQGVQSWVEGLSARLIPVLSDRERRWRRRDGQGEISPEEGGRDGRGPCLAPAADGARVDSARSGISALALPEGGEGLANGGGGQESGHQSRHSGSAV